MKTCYRCKIEIVKPEDSILTGYGIGQDGQTYCYDCCRDIDIEEADKTGKLFAYVNLDKREITTWTGRKLGRISYPQLPYRSNFGDVRQHIYFEMPDPSGKMHHWHGTYYKSSGDYIRAKRLKD